MARMRLSETNVWTLPCPKGKERETYFDTTKGTPAGFALPVMAKGCRSYVLSSTSRVRVPVAG